MDESAPYYNTFNTPHSPKAYPPVQQRGAYAGTSELHNTSNLQPYGVSPYGPPPDPLVGGYSVPPFQDQSLVLASTFHQTAPGPTSSEAQLQYAPQDNAHPSGSSPEHPSPLPTASSTQTRHQ